MPDSWDDVLKEGEAPKAEAASWDDVVGKKQAAASWDDVVAPRQATMTSRDNATPTYEQKRDMLRRLGIAQSFQFNAQNASRAREIAQAMETPDAPATVDLLWENRLPNIKTQRDYRVALDAVDVEEAKQEYIAFAKANPKATGWTEGKENYVPAFTPEEARAWVATKRNNAEDYDRRMRWITRVQANAQGLMTSVAGRQDWTDPAKILGTPGETAEQTQARIDKFASTAGLGDKVLLSAAQIGPAVLPLGRVTKALSAFKIPAEISAPLALAAHSALIAPEGEKGEAALHGAAFGSLAGSAGAILKPATKSLLAAVVRPMSPSAQQAFFRSMGKYLEEAIPSAGAFAVAGQAINPQGDSMVDALVGGFLGLHGARSAAGGKGGLRASLADLQGLERAGFRALKEATGDVLGKVGKTLGALPVINQAKAKLTKVAERWAPQAQGVRMREALAESAYELAAGRDMARYATESMSLNAEGKPLSAGEQASVLSYFDPSRHEVTRPSPQKVAEVLGEKRASALEYFVRRRNANEAELLKTGWISKETYDAFMGGEAYSTRSYEDVLRFQEGGGIPRGFKSLPKNIQRQDLTPERRAELGEILDPAVVIPTTLAKQEAILSVARLFKKLSDNPRHVSDEWREGLDETPIPKEGPFGALKGKYISPAVRRFLGSRGAGDSPVTQFLNGILSDWKYGVVAGRPAALARDLVGNGLMAEAEGVSFGDMRTGVADVRAFSVLRSKPGDPLYQHKQMLIRRGLMDGTSFEPDVLKLMDEVASIRGGKTFADKVGAYAKIKGLHLLRGRINMATPGLEVIAKLRMAQDSWFRARSYFYHLGEGFTPAESVRIVQESYPYFGKNISRAFSTGGGAFGAVARLAGPVPPFVNFMEWGARRAMRFLTESPLSALAAYSLLKSNNDSAWRAAGIGDDERDRILAVTPRYRRPGLLRPMLHVEKDGNPVVMDFTYFVPMGDEIERITGAWSDFVGSSPQLDNESLRSLPLGPFGAMAAQAAFNRQLLGDRPIDTSRDAYRGARQSPEQGQRDAFEWYARSLFPTYRDVSRVVKAVRGIPVDREGRVEASVLRSTLDALAGIKIRESRTTVDTSYAIRDLENQIKETIRGIENTESDARIDEEAKIRAREEGTHQIARLYLRALYYRLGKPDIPEDVAIKMDPRVMLGEVQGMSKSAYAEAKATAPR